MNQSIRRSLLKLLLVPAPASADKQRGIRSQIRCISKGHEQMIRRVLKEPYHLAHAETVEPASDGIDDDFDIRLVPVDVRVSSRPDVDPVQERHDSIAHAVRSRNRTLAVVVESV